MTSCQSLAAIYTKSCQTLVTIIIIDKKVPKKFKELIKKKLNKYKVFIFYFNASEKAKSFNFVNHYLNKLLFNNFNRTDLIIGVGGGITGDFSGFVASIFKRGINFINIPSTLLAQVDSAIGGKTGGKFKPIIRFYKNN